MHGEVGAGSSDEPSTGDPWARPDAPPANPGSVPSAPVSAPVQPGVPSWDPGIPAGGPVPPGYPPAGWPYPSPFPAGPPPSPQKAARRFGWGALIAVTAVALLLGCVAGAVVGYAVHRNPTSTTVAGAIASPAQPRAGAPTALGDGNALLAEILAVPADARAVTVKGTTNGVMDLDQYATKLFAHPDQNKIILRGRGFQVAAERDWIGADGVEVHILLTQFEDADGAEGFTLSQSLAYHSDPVYVASFPIPGATHGEGFERSGLTRRATTAPR